MSDETPLLRDVVRQGRIRKGMTQEELSEAIGMSQEWVSKIEAGDITYPRRKTLERLAFVLQDVSFTDLLIAAGYARTKADAARVAAAPDSERTIGDRIDALWNDLSPSERSFLETMIRTQERQKRRKSQ
jgi:transcriptional regulator with XRE-family HTH domain